MAEFTFDKKIKVGDYITAYEAGYHIVTGLRRGGSSGTLVEYKRVLTSEGKGANSGVKCCDGSYCKKLTKEFVDQLINEKYEGFLAYEKGLRSLIQEKENK